MATKPTYEELEQRVKKLEKEAVDRKVQGSESTKMQHTVLEMLKAIPGTLNVVDKDYNIFAVGGEIARKIEDTSRIIGEKCYKTFQERDNPCPWCKVDRVIETGEIINTTTTPDDPREKLVGKPLSVYIRPLKDKHGNIIGAIEIGTDITQIRKAEEERKLVEETLRESEERLSAIQDISPIPTAVSSSDGLIISFNEALERLTGYRKDEMTDVASWANELYPDKQYRNFVLENIQQALRGEKQDCTEFEITRKDGSTRIVDFYTSFFKDGLIIQMVDVTERVRAEEALQESEKRFRAMFGSAQDCIFIKDKALRYTHVNPAMETLFGLSSSELVAKTDGELFGEEATSHIKEVDFRVLGGETVEEDDTKPVGGIPTTFHVVKAPMRDSSGKITGLSGIARDITERKRAEELIKQSLKEKEVLLAEIHHRVKNNLQIISGLLDMSIIRTQNQEIIDVLQDSRLRIHTMALIHEQLYRSERFNKIDMIKNISDLVDTQIAFYASKEKSIKLVIEGTDVYLTINQAIPCALVLNELISNAYKHAFKGRELGTIAVSARRADDSVFIMVKDDGVGIPESEDINRVNTLGLKLVKNLVQNQLKGGIKVNRNNGTEIIIEFKTLLDVRMC